MRTAYSAPELGTEEGAKGFFNRLLYSQKFAT
jgi:hypothetical protein